MQSEKRPRPGSRGGALTHRGVVSRILAPARNLKARIATRLRMSQLRKDLEEERIRTLNAVQAERSRLYQLFMNAPAIICVVRGPQFIFELANPMYLRLIGREEKDVIGKPAREVLPELEGQGYWEILERVYATGETFVGKEMLSRLDRREKGKLEDVYLNFIYQPTRDASGKIDGILAHAVDVTDEVRARRKLAEVADRLKAITDNASFALFVMDDRQRCTFMNPAAEEMTGFPFAEILAADKPLHDIIHNRRPDGRPYPMSECLIDRALPGRNRITGEDVFVRKDGSFYPVAFTASPVLSEGKPVGTVIEVRDTTSEKQAQEALAAQRRVYHAILSSTPDLAYVFDLQHRFTYANDALLRMWGKTWDEAIGRTCLELGYPDWHAAMHDRELEQVKATKRPVRGEVPFTGTHGRRIYDYIFVPVLDAKGEVEAIAGTTRDVTELREHASTLETMVASRTAELKSSIDELERFTYTVAHDLRAPLRAVHRFSELLVMKHPDLPPTAHKYIGQVLEGAKSMDRLIGDLLAYSRIGRSETKLESIDTGAVIKEVLGTLSAQIQEREARVEIAQENFPHALADKFLLGQILTNLVTNAIKFVPGDRKPAIQIGTRPHDSRVRIWVKDNGIGIDPRYKDQVFKLFERLHSQEDFPGTGIGLAIVSRAVERMGGRVGLESEPGKGSEFWIELPQGPKP